MFYRLAVSGLTCVGTLIILVNIHLNLAETVQRMTDVLGTTGDCILGNLVVVPLCAFFRVRRSFRRGLIKWIPTSRRAFSK